MPRMIAIVIELAIFAGALWLLFFLSVLLHEAGHAIGFFLATRDTHWHIRVGSGRTLLNTRRLTVKLLPFDGCFMPSEKNRIDTTAKLVATLSGGPVASLVLVVALLIDTDLPAKRSRPWLCPRNRVWPGVFAGNNGLVHWQHARGNASRAAESWRLPDRSWNLL